MFCSKCGANVTDGAAFCSACGQPTSAVTPLGSRARAAALPVLPAPYAAPALAPLPPSPYAGFWLRVVAHLIDDLLLGIGFGILALIGVAIVGVGSLRTMFEGMNGEDPADSGGRSYPRSFCCALCAGARMDLQCRDGKFPASRHAGENGAGLVRHRPARHGRSVSATPAEGISRRSSPG